MEADEPDLGQAACLVDFFQLYRNDAERGAVRELEDYARRFPGYEALVAREYAALRERVAGSQGAASSASASVLPGYRTLRELGTGGQGTVYLAEDVSLKRLVALKVVRTTLGKPTPTQRARLEREVAILARLDHPGICAVFRAHLEHNPPFVAMRYVPGLSLAALLGASPDAAVLPCRPGSRAELDRLLAFFEEAAHALHAAHEAGIVHRDIKPGNVICDERGRPVLLDFGIARPVDDDGLTVTRTGESFGTPAYMSPEQLLQPASDLDRRTDVYSLGVTLFECLTGKRPFDEPSQRQLERAICEGSPPRASQLNPALPGDLDVVLGTALEKDVRRRYATALDLASELRRVRERRPVLARPTSAILRTRRWSQRNPAVATAIVLLLLGAAGLTVALVRLARASAHTEQALQLAESRTLAASALTMLERDPVQALDLALDSHDLAPGVHSRVALYRALADQRVSRVIELPRVANTVAFAADRSALACIDARYTGLLVVGLPDGQHLLDVVLPATCRAVDVTPRGALVAAGLADGRVLLYRDGEARPALVLAAGTGAIRSVAFSPDAALLATGGDDDLVRLWELPSGRELAAMPGSAGPPCGLAFSPDGSLLTSWVMEIPDVPDRPDPIVRVWNVAAHRPAVTLDGHVDRVVVARYSPDGSLLASASDDGTVRVWELPAGRCRFVLEHPGHVADVAFSPDGSQLATAFDPGPPGFSLASGAWVHSVADGSRQLELQGHEARTVSTIEFSPDGTRIATGSYDGTARIWDAGDGRELACVRSMQGLVNTTRWLGTGEELLVRYLYQAVVVRRDGDVGMPRLTGHAAPIVHATFFADGARVATCDTVGLTLVHDTRTGALLASMADGSAPVLGVASCVGDRILTASADGSCRLYDAGTGQRLWSLRIGAEPVTLLRVLPDGTRFLAASGAVLALFEVESGRRLVEYRGHDAPLACLDISPDGRVLATGAADRSARLWDLATGNCQEVLTDWLPTAFDTERAVYAVLFHADGKALLTSAEDGVVRDYRLPECELIHSDGPTARIGRLAALPDGRQAVLMSKWSTSVQLLDLDSFERVPITPSIVGRMLSMDVSPDGALILACSTDGTTMLWSSDARDLWASVTGHSGPVLFAAFTPDGSGFLTASTDGIARIWPSHPAAAARARRPEVIALDAR